MRIIDKEILELKNEIAEMFDLVQHQLARSLHAIQYFNQESAKEVMLYEKRINSQELVIDKACEQFVVKFNPVAVDMRFAFATFKINSHLERLGDNAKGIARFVKELDKGFDSNLMERLQLSDMIELGLQMTKLNLDAYLNDDTSTAKLVFELDHKIDIINFNATDIITNYMKENIDEIKPCLSLISTIRKLERVGDLNLNIAEEIVFYVDAKVMKHSKEFKLKNKEK
ncbi:MAG: phosphate signaling complex protein PhoU [Saprospiraceae bacterium]|nr:phosphate signaling complex protein PhoU [Saprospiraceae bacterium]MBK9992622.1 phosphate signaling complex protein PhoU [Saprospiraceae bacterium]